MRKMSIRFMPLRTMVDNEHCLKRKLIKHLFSGQCSVFGVLKIDILLTTINSNCHVTKLMNRMEKGSKEKKTNKGPSQPYCLTFNIARITECAY